MGERLVDSRRVSSLDVCGGGEMKAKMKAIGNQTV